jgi:GNAT superfamily N-acetyltransferase
MTALGPSMTKIVVKFRNDESLLDIISFYETQDYFGGATQDDKIVLAIDEGKIIGVARVSIENETYSLRGMFIDSKYQRQGIGSRMLEKLDDFLGTLNQDCYCIPHDNLDVFYNQLGFQTIPKSEGPQHLIDRIDEYFAKGYEVFLMKRPCSPA